MPRILLLSNPRSGSCFLQDLLRCHPEIQLAGELLNDQHGLIEQPLETVQKRLCDMYNTFIGLKLFPEQLYTHKLHFGDFITRLGISQVVVLWRESALETYVSLMIAMSSNEWYSTAKSNGIRQIEINPEEFLGYFKHLCEQWEQIGEEWPAGVRPIFVSYEDLTADPAHQVKRILGEMRCSCDVEAFVTPSKRQNPAEIQEKVVNYGDLPLNVREMVLNVEKILLGKIRGSLLIPENLPELAPDREPYMPPGGWRYRVIEPYLPSIAKQYAVDAINSGNVSSVEYWPQELTLRLRAFFHVPVAQPCSNGFTALFVALQAANVGEGDEVLVPAMTTMAVPNAVHFRRATPVFVDNSQHGYNPSWREYDAGVTTKTKAVVVTHTYGVAAGDIEFIAQECRSHGWILIEDISECVGVTCTNSQGQEQLLGTFGDFAIASLYTNKIVHGGDGGFIITKDVKFDQRLASIVNHGLNPDFNFVHFEPSPNAKIHGVGAAVACGVLEDVQHVLKHRSKLSKWYRNHLDGIPLTKMPECGPLDTPWVFGVECASKEERSQLRTFLAHHGVETRDYYFALHLQPAYMSNTTELPDLPHAETLGSTGFYLPSHTNLTEQDIGYICHVVKTYFTYDRENGIEQASLINPPPLLMKSQYAVQITPDGFSLQVRQYRNTGALLKTLSQDHIYLDAVKLGIDAEDALLHERHDKIHLLLASLKDLLSKTNDDPLGVTIQSYFSPFMAYFNSQTILEQPLDKPWLQIDLNGEQFEISREIPTLVDSETLQLLAWLIQQRKPNTVWEICSWMGRVTALTVEMCHTANIFACDRFQWKMWMHGVLKGTNMFKRDDKSFLDVFMENLKTCKDHVQPVTWPADISTLPALLDKEYPEFVFLNIGEQEANKVEETWTIIKGNLIPNETILLFNGLSYKSLPFFTTHANELRAVAKPQSAPAKAFLYVDQTEVENLEKTGVSLLERRLKFYTNPGWGHHHNNLFCQAVDVLRQEFHCDQATVLFVPAVEEATCQDIELMYRNPWIGIIHSVESHPELFYSPDLQRLCSRRRYLAALKNCRGLFTLTSLQAQYLTTHLPDNIPNFPIQRLYYPGEVQDSVLKPSRVLQRMTENNSEKVTLLHVGSFSRDFDFFFKAVTPAHFQKELVTGDETCREAALTAPADVVIVGRLSEEEYEAKLRDSIVFLTLKHKGAANTLVLECIARNVPILSPNFSSCMDYLGESYPLFYDPQKPEHLAELLTPESIQRAITYLEQMDKSKYTYERFLRDFKSGAVMLGVPPIERPTDISSLGHGLTPTGKQFDVTICICTFKRTHNLPTILEALWDQQDFSGTYEILLWNNNQNRYGEVEKYVQNYLKRSHEKKAVKLISSTENHYCSIRFTMASLMRGKCLLTCDDDIIPGGNYISFFHSAHEKHPEDVLCVRGHEFLPHQLDVENPRKVWTGIDNGSLLFRADAQPEQLLHFVDADACLIPKQAVREVASVEMPDPSFVLVNDYWMSFVLGHQFNRKLRKLSTAGRIINPVVRTPDSETLGLALHTTPEVQDAQLRLYLHHMLQGWPAWDLQSGVKRLSEAEKEYLRKEKLKFWYNYPQVGYNVSSLLNDSGIEALAKLGVRCVRVGAVGVGNSRFYEFSEFVTASQQEVDRLREFIKKLEKIGIAVILTLDRRVASSQTWALLAKEFVTVENVVGYDLINEPYTDTEIGLHWTEIELEDDIEMQKLVEMYQEMMLSIRQVDPVTPIILEPSFWGQIGALSKFPVESFLQLDDNILMSVHFYDPVRLTSRKKNRGRYSFPGAVRWYDEARCSEETVWTAVTILEELQKAKAWADSKGVRIFLGEFGICRDIGGAPEYLEAVMSACQEVGLIGLLYAFRSPDWEAMDYEFGDKVTNCLRIYDENLNPFIHVIKKGVKSSYGQHVSK